MPHLSKRQPHFHITAEIFERKYWLQQKQMGKRIFRTLTNQHQRRIKEYFEHRLFYFHKD
jgi:hypothetical protein